MNPSARLRTLPRSASLSAAKAFPCTLTSPAVGASSPPSRCSSVLLPDPDAPTTATRSPGATARSTPRSTGTSSGPPRYVLFSLRHSSTGASPVLFIAQRLRRIDSRRPPARIERRQESKRQGDRRDEDHVGTLHFRRQLADVVHALVEKLDAEQLLHERHNGLDIDSKREAASHTQQRPDGPDQRTLNHEDRQDARRRRALRAQDGDEIGRASW